MFFSYFAKSLTEDEHALLYGFVYSIIAKTCNFECNVDYIKFLKPHETIKHFEKIKTRLAPENAHIADSIIKKINDYLIEL